MIIHGILDFVGDFAGGFLEFLDALAEALGELGYFLGAEKNQDGRENHNQFSTAHSKNCKTCIHKIVS